MLCFGILRNNESKVFDFDLESSAPAEIYGLILDVKYQLDPNSLVLRLAS